jgi:long-subunit acyl-CoA synthetase (AMP-forming)
MSRLMARLRAHVQYRPDAPAVAGDRVVLTYDRLLEEVERLAALLPGRRMGLLLDNGPAWVVADLAALLRNITCVPLPNFFTDEQLVHAMRDAEIDCLLTDQPGRVERLVADIVRSPVTVAGEPLTLGSLAAVAPAHVPSDCAKITYTSGSTGEPRGVCLTRRALEDKAETLARATAAGPGDASLCVTPLSTLLENIGGIYVPLLAGAVCHVLPLRVVGLAGSSGLDVAQMMRALNACRPSSVIVIPQQLRALLAAVARGACLPGSLRFIAVGGAPVANDLLLRAEQAGLPVYQGYGLSEAVSVVALNTTDANRTGSVGRPLAGVTVRIAPDGEIMVRGTLFAGYLGHPPMNGAELATGDLGYVDDDGYLYVVGRKKNAYATAYGRNVSPEWIEGELLNQGAVAQAVVFGEASPVNVAVIVPIGGMRDAEISAAVEVVNRRLPDYARVGRYVLATEPFSVTNGQLTGTGRPRRDTIAQRYAGTIRSLQQEAV